MQQEIGTLQPCVTTDSVAVGPRIESKLERDGRTEMPSNYLVRKYFECRAFHSRPDSAKSIDLRTFMVLNCSVFIAVRYRGDITTHERMGEKHTLISASLSKRGGVM